MPNEVVKPPEMYYGDMGEFNSSPVSPQEELNQELDTSSPEYIKSKYDTYGLYTLTPKEVKLGFQAGLISKEEGLAYLEEKENPFSVDKVKDWFYGAGRGAVAAAVDHANFLYEAGQYAQELAKDVADTVGLDGEAVKQVTGMALESGPLGALASKKMEMPEALKEKPETVGGQAVEKLVEYGSAFIGAKKVVAGAGLFKGLAAKVGNKYPKLAALGEEALEDAVAGGISSYIVRDPYEEKLTDMLLEMQPGLRDTVAGILKTNPNDPLWMDRTKAALEDVVIGGAIDVAVRPMLYLLKGTSLRLWKKAGMEPEVVEGALKRVEIEVAEKESLSTLQLTSRENIGDALAGVSTPSVAKPATLEINNIELNSALRKVTPDEEKALLEVYSHIYNNTPVPMEVANKVVKVMGSSADFTQDLLNTGVKESEKLLKALETKPLVKTVEGGLEAAEEAIKKGETSKFFNESLQKVAKLDETAVALQAQVRVLTASVKSIIENNLTAVRNTLGEGLENTTALVREQDVMDAIRALPEEVKHGLYKQIESIQDLTGKYALFQKQAGRVVNAFKEIDYNKVAQFKGIVEDDIDEIIKPLLKEGDIDGTIKEFLDRTVEFEEALQKKRASYLPGPNAKLGGKYSVLSKRMDNELVEDKWKARLRLMKTYSQATKLFNLSTHKLNVLGTSIASAWQVGNGVIGDLIALGINPNKAQFRAIVSQGHAFRSLLKDNFKGTVPFLHGLFTRNLAAYLDDDTIGHVWKALYSGETSFGRTAITSESGQVTNILKQKLNFTVKGIEIPLGSIASTPFHLLAAEDEFFKTALFRYKATANAIDEAMRLATLSGKFDEGVFKESFEAMNQKHSIGFINDALNDSYMEAREYGLKDSAALRNYYKKLAPVSMTDEKLAIEYGKKIADIAESAKDWARYTTFSNDFDPNSLVGKAANVLGDTKGGLLVSALHMPFFGFGIRALTMAAKESPLNLNMWTKLFDNGLTTRQRCELGSKLVTGVLASALIFDLVNEGTLTGPVDKWDEARGIRPYSVVVPLEDGRVGYVSLENQPIIGPWVAFVAGLTKLHRRYQLQPEDKQTLLAKAAEMFVEVTGPHTGLKALSDLLDIVDGDTSAIALQRYGRRMVVGMLPASSLFSSDMRKLDSIERETYSNSGLEGFVKDVADMYLDWDNLLPRRDRLWGNPPENIYINNTFKVSPRKDDDIHTEMHNISWYPTGFDRTIRKGIGNGRTISHELTPKEYDMLYDRLLLLKDAQAAAYRQLFASEEYQNTNNMDEKRAMVSKIHSEAKKAVIDSFIADGLAGKAGGLSKESVDSILSNYKEQEAASQGGKAYNSRIPLN